MVAGFIGIHLIDLVRAMLRSKPCKHCGSEQHTAFNCPHKPKKTLQARTALKPKRRLKKMGRIGKALADQRELFLRENDPPYNCIYCLVIGIDIPLLPEEFDVEHGKSKTRHPGLRFSKGNLYVACKAHNQDKGSKDIDEYIEELQRRMNVQYK